MAATGDARVVTGGSTAVATVGAGCLDGWALRETAGAVASWRLRDGTTVAGPIIACGNLAAAGTTHMSAYGVAFRTGLYFEVVAGAIEGVVVVS